MIIEAEAQRLGITNEKTKGELGRRTREKKDAASEIHDGTAQAAGKRACPMRSGRRC